MLILRIGSSNVVFLSTFSFIDYTKMYRVIKSINVFKTHCSSRIIYSSVTYGPARTY